jgi:MFS family permease
MARFIWGLGALLYLMGFSQRVAPAVITAELMRDFQIHASALGYLSAFYFYSYVAVQIPTGIIADRWGPRRLLTTGALTAGVGTILFALAPKLVWANTDRLLIGGTGTMMGPMLLQPAVGWILDHHWQGAMDQGIRIYSPQAYQYGFGLMVAWNALALLLLLFTRESHCRQIESNLPDVEKSPTDA